LKKILHNANAKSHTHCQVAKTSHINQNLSISMSLPAQIEVNKQGIKSKGYNTAYSKLLNCYK